MATQFNIREIWRSAFGVEPPIEPIIAQAPSRINNSLKGGKYYDTDDQGTEHFMPVRIDGRILPYAIVDFTSRKIVVSTPMTERPGSVHELVGTDDQLITIRALLIDDNFPEAQMIDWHAVFEKNKSVEMRCVKTDVFLKGDDRVIIKEAKWPPIQGVEHVQPLELSLVTDKVFTLEI